MSSIPREALKTSASKPGAIAVASSRTEQLGARDDLLRIGDVGRRDLVYDLGRRVTEHALGADVEELDHAFLVGRDDREIGAIEDGTLKGPGLQHASWRLTSVITLDVPVSPSRIGKSPSIAVMVEPSLRPSVSGRPLLPLVDGEAKYEPRGKSAARVRRRPAPTGRLHQFDRLLHQCGRPMPLSRARGRTTPATDGTAAPRRTLGPTPSSWACHPSYTHRCTCSTGTTRSARPAGAWRASGSRC